MNIFGLLLINIKEKLFQLSGCHLLTKASLSLHSSTGKGKENITQSSWIQKRTKRDHLPVTVTGKHLEKLALLNVN